MSAIKNINFSFVRDGLSYINKDETWLNNCSSEDIDKAVLDILDEKIRRFKELTNYVKTLEPMDIFEKIEKIVEKINEDKRIWGNKMINETFEKMKDNMMTVGDIRNYIKNLPDDMKVLVHYNIPYTNDQSEMVPLGNLYVEYAEEEERVRVLEIYPLFPRY